MSTDLSLPVTIDASGHVQMPGLQRMKSDAVEKLKGAWLMFASFALRDKVIEVAVGLIIGTAFTSVVNALATGVILPPVSLLPYLSRNMAEKFLVLREGPLYKHPGGYNTRSQAIKDGAVILTYGAFINRLINFMGIVIVLYLLAHVYEMFSSESIIKHAKCPYCMKAINLKAKRCPLCTSWLDGREEKETHLAQPPVNDVPDASLDFNHGRSVGLVYGKVADKLIRTLLPFDSRENRV